MASTYLTLNISYNANGGSGAPGTTGVKVPAGVASDYPRMVSATVATGSPVRSGYTFLGWSMSVGGTPSIHGGQTLTHTFQTYSSSSQTYTIALYAIWSQQTYTVTYLPGSYGSGSSATDTKYGGTTLTLRGRLFTRSGYYQSGWSTSANGSGFAYGLGGSYSLNAAITLYPYWTIIKSTITSVTSSVPADGSTQGTVQINRPDSAFTHKVVIQLGSRSQEITNVGLSCTFTVPQAWIDQIPAATSATAKVLLYTYRGSSQVGTADTKNFTITVPASIVPSVSVTSENLSDNATVDGWDTLVQGFSKIKLTATATAGSGSSIASVAFSGDGVSQTGTALTATSAVLTNAGSRTWTVVVTDRRGRTASATITRTVYEYYTASIQSFVPFRSTINGVDDPGTGTYITVTPVYSIASCNGNNSVSVKKIEYKINTGSTWTVGQASASSGTTYTFGTISVLYAYNVRITVTDALGSTVVYSVQIPSAIGFSFGLNGQCARFGGPVQYDDRFEVDWDAQFDGVVDVVNRRVSASLSSAGWYRVLSYNINSETGAKLATACSVDINICTTYNNTTNVSRFVRMLGRYNQVQFSDETSLQSASSPVIDKIRYTYDSNHNGHIDIHYALSVSNGVVVQFDVRTANLAYRSMFVSESLQSVADAPTGETIMTSYDFAQRANGGIITTEISITTDSNGYYSISAYPRDKYMILNVLPLLKSDYYAMPTGSSGSTGQWVRVHKANGTAAASESMTIRLAMIHI